VLGVADAASSPVELVTAGVYLTLFQFFGLKQYFPFVFTHFQTRIVRAALGKIALGEALFYFIPGQCTDSKCVSFLKTV
jgi:hypothetical protein